MSLRRRSRWVRMMTSDTASTAEDLTGSRPAVSSLSGDEDEP
jgi:hypothetical protein